MANFPTTWGLDIGESSVKAVRLSRVGSGVKVSAYAVEPIEHGDEVDRDAAVAEALRTIVQRQDMTREPVIAALSGRQVFSKSINLPVINPKTVHRMIELEAQQQIPGDIDEVMWGYHLSPSAQDDGSYDVALFAAKKDIVEQMVATCQAVGVNLAGVSITGMAVYNFISYDQDFDDDESVIVLDVGAENTDLVVYQGDALWMRNLRVSGNEITRAFMKKFRVTFEEAERLKQEVNESNQADRIMRVIEGSLGDLVAEIKRSLGFYKGQNEEARFENVVVCGNTFRLELLSEFLADRLGYPIIALVELERIEMDISLNRDVFLEELQGMSTAMGLALQGVGLAKADVNLLPRDVQLQRMLDSKRWAGVVVAVLLLLAVAIGYTIKNNRIATYVGLIGDIEDGRKQEKKNQKEALELATSLVPLATTLNQFDRVGLQRAVVQTVQVRVMEAVDRLATDPTAMIAEPSLKAKDGGDPVRQPLYLESFELPAQPTSADQVFAPSAGGRVCSLVVRIPHSADFREINNRLKRDLRALTIGEPLATIYGLPADTALFSLVEARPGVDRSDTWRYFNPYNMNRAGDIAPIDLPRDLRVKETRFECVLTELVPSYGGGEGRP